MSCADNINIGEQNNKPWSVRNHCFVPYCSINLFFAFFRILMLLLSTLAFAVWLPPSMKSRAGAKARKAFGEIYRGNENHRGKQ